MAAPIIDYMSMPLPEADICHLRRCSCVHPLSAEDVRKLLAIVARLATMVNDGEPRNYGPLERISTLCNKAILSKKGLRHCNAPRGHEGECP